jgi:hypothetical protein
MSLELPGGVENATAEEVDCYAGTEALTQRSGRRIRPFTERFPSVVPDDSTNKQQFIAGRLLAKRFASSIERKLGL